MGEGGDTVWFVCCPTGFSDPSPAKDNQLENSIVGFWWGLGPTSWKTTIWLTDQWAKYFVFQDDFLNQNDFFEKCVTVLGAML